MNRQLLVRVAAGGVVGSALRWALEQAIDGGSFPTWLLVANVLGCCLLGAVARAATSQETQRLLGPGVAGGLTSMSALAVWLAATLQARDPGLAMVGLGMMLVAGGASYVLGDIVGQRLIAMQHGKVA